MTKMCTSKHKVIKHLYVTGKKKNLNDHKKI